MKQMLQDAVGRVNDDNLIDRRVLNRLLLTMVENKSKRILDLVTGMLRVSEEEKIGLSKLLLGNDKQNARTSWFSSSNSPRVHRQSNTHSTSLSQMWVAFLMEVLFNIILLI